MVDKITAFIKKQIKQGVTPEKIALTVAMGSVLGLFPVPGVTTLLCVMAASVLRLNHAVIQVVNYAVYPLQLILMGGYYALGSQWFGLGDATTSVVTLTTLLQDNFWGGLWSMKQYILYAMAVWMVTSPVIAVGLYLPVRYSAMKIRRFTQHPADNHMKLNGSIAAQGDASVT